MKSSAKNIENEYQGLFDDANLSSEHTNPFSKNNANNANNALQKAGKRPRIMKPLYSVRLS
jgi:hypothetical protein